jgi:peptide deformylase
MAVRQIARMGADVLKNRAEPVRDFADPALPVLVSDMVETMLSAHGIGLAAPQVFVPLRIVIFFVPGERNNGVEIPLTVMINPEIQPFSAHTEEEWEACLSVPGLTGRVPRHTAIRYFWQDIHGNRFDRDAHGFHARVVQHECDHLDGMLYPLRMTDMSSLSFVDALKQEAAVRGEVLELDEEGEAAA